MSTTKQGTKVMVATLSNIPEKYGKEVIVGDTSIALFKVNGTVKAVENKCPHKNGPLSQGIVSGEHVFCPLHDWKINICDGLVQKPDIGCVKTFQTEVEGDKVFLHL